MSKHSKDGSHKIGRDAGNGQFIPVETARRMGNRAVVETIKPQTPKPPTKKK